MSTANRIMKNSLSILSATIIQKVVSFLVTIYLARYLQVEGYGRYAFAIAFTAIFTEMISFGLDLLTIREVARNRSRVEEWMGSIFLLKWMFTGVTLVMIVIIIQLMRKPVEVVFSVYILTVSLVFSGLASVFESVFSSFERFELRAVSITGSVIIKTLLTLIGIMQGQGLLFFVWAILSGELVRFVLGYILCIKSFLHLKIKKPIAFPVKILKSTVPFALFSLVYAIYWRIDTVLLSLLKGDRAVGIYSAGFILIDMFMALAFSYHQAILPVLSRMKNDSSDSFRLIYEKSLKYMCLGGIPVAVGGTLLSEKLMYFMYKGNYGPSAQVLQVLIWVVPFMFCKSLFIRSLYAVNREKLVARVICGGAIAKVLLNLALVPHWGYLATCVAVVLVEAVCSGFLFYFMGKEMVFSFQWVNMVVKPGLAALLMGIFLWTFSGWGIFRLILLAVVLYLIMLFMFKVIEKSDIIIFKRAFKLSG